MLYCVYNVPAKWSPVCTHGCYVYDTLSMNSAWFICKLAHCPAQYSVHRYNTQY